MLTLQNIAYRVEGRLLFEGVTAQIGARQRRGLVGRNGCGKTTLLRLIAGRLDRPMKARSSAPAAYPSGWSTKRCRAAR